MRDRYIRSPSDVNRVMMTYARKHYKYVPRKKRIEYDKIQTKKLMDARCKNVKLYWKMLAGKNRSKTPCPISTGEWYNHFMHLANPDGDFFVADAEISREVRLLIESDFVDLFQELNIPISTDEIMNAIKDLQKMANAVVMTCSLMNCLYMEETCYARICYIYLILFSTAVFFLTCAVMVYCPLYTKEETD